MFRLGHPRAALGRLAPPATRPFHPPLASRGADRLRASARCQQRPLDCKLRCDPRREMYLNLDAGQAHEPATVSCRFCPGPCWRSLSRRPPAPACRLSPPAGLALAAGVGSCRATRPLCSQSNRCAASDLDANHDARLHRGQPRHAIRAAPSLGSARRPFRHTETAALPASWAPLHGPRMALWHTSMARDFAGLMAARGDAARRPGLSRSVAGLHTRPSKHACRPDKTLHQTTQLNVSGAPIRLRKRNC